MGKGARSRCGLASSFSPPSSFSPLPGFQVPGAAAPFWKTRRRVVNYMRPHSTSLFFPPFPLFFAAADIPGDEISKPAQYSPIAAARSPHLSPPFFSLFFRVKVQISAPPIKYVLKNIFFYSFSFPFRHNHPLQIKEKAPCGRSTRNTLVRIRLTYFSPPPFPPPLSPVE